MINEEDYCFKCGNKKEMNFKTKQKECRCCGKRKDEEFVQRRLK